MRRIAAAGAVVLSLVLSGGSLALAGGDGAGASDDAIWVNPLVKGRDLDPGGGGGDSDPCDYVAVPEDPEGDDTTQGTKIINGVKHYLFYQDCLDGLPIGAVWVPQLTPRDLLPDIEAFLEDRLHYPTASFEPVDSEFGWVYVQVPIDYRVAAGEWEPVEAYAEVTNPLGTVWVRATATPIRLLFEPGDPASNGASCAGAGPVAPYDPAVPGECSFTFHNASSTADNGETFAGSIAIVWEATWVSSDPTQFGTLNVGPTQTDLDIAVAEAKALVTCTGGFASQGDC